MQNDAPVEQATAAPGERRETGVPSADWERRALIADSLLHQCRGDVELAIEFLRDAAKEAGRG